jgi:hypothetical protein
VPYNQLFWLHIKKAAGSTTRALLQPHYVEVDRIKRPITFIQAKREEYNDILNNYRVPLGQYQFRRCLFAKRYLYPNQWDDLFSFAFSREPVDRCVSMFYYLHWHQGSYIRNFLRSCNRSLRARKAVFYNTAYAFDEFLDHVQEARVSDSIYKPLGNHFTTHTAPVWDDITDGEGVLLLKAVFRVEALAKGINRAFEAIGASKRVADGDCLINKNHGRRPYTPTAGQLRKIHAIYKHDFEIYESAER